VTVSEAKSAQTSPGWSPSLLADRGRQTWWPAGLSWDDRKAS